MMPVLRSLVKATLFVPPRTVQMTPGLRTRRSRPPLNPSETTPHAGVAHGSQLSMLNQNESWMQNAAGARVGEGDESAVGGEQADVRGRRIFGGAGFRFQASGFRLA